jgi:hypothetical protein
MRKDKVDPVSGLVASWEREILESWGGKRPPRRKLRRIGNHLGSLAAYAANGELALMPRDISDIAGLALRLLAATDAVWNDEKLAERLFGPTQRLSDD